MKATAIYLAIFIAAAALFSLIPQIDLLTSRWFYLPGHGFFLRNSFPVQLLFHSVPWLATAMVAVIVGGAGWLFLVQRPLWRLDRKALLFLAVSMALGPGLIVNSVLKDHWGRARPSQIESLGGLREFTPALVPAAQCPQNCSFPSGHAALGYSLAAFAFLLPAGARRRQGVTAAIALGSLIGTARIAQGAHFLSDVVFAGLLVYGTTAVLYQWVVVRDGLATPMLLRFYRAAGRMALAAWPPMRRISMSPTAPFGGGTVFVAVLVVLSIEIVDRPLAVMLHAQGPDIHALFDLIGRLGLGFGWLTGFGLGFVALHWGGRLPRLRPFDRRLRALSSIPAFLFAAIAASGIAADLLKVICGRARPKLLFSADIYGFTGFAWHADHWSFPSGHAATIVSLVAALWYLWPSHILFYIAIAVLVAASRVVTGAHFLSDAIAGAWLALLTTRGVVLLFARAEIDLTAVRSGRPSGARTPLRICRRFRGTAPARNRPDLG